MRAPSRSIASASFSFGDTLKRGSRTFATMPSSITCSVTVRVPGWASSAREQRLGALGGQPLLEDEADFLGVPEAHVGERPDLVGDDLAAVLADLELAGDVDRLVGGDPRLVAVRYASGHTITSIVPLLSSRLKVA